MSYHGNAARIFRIRQKSQNSGQQFIQICETTSIVVQDRTKKDKKLPFTLGNFDVTFEYYGIVLDKRIKFNAIRPVIDENRNTISGFSIMNEGRSDEHCYIVCSTSIKIVRLDNTLSYYTDEPIHYIFKGTDRSIARLYSGMSYMFITSHGSNRIITCHKGLIE